MRLVLILTTLAMFWVVTIKADAIVGTVWAAPIAIVFALWGLLTFRACTSARPA